MYRNKKGGFDYSALMSFVGFCIVCLMFTQ